MNSMNQSRIKIWAQRNPITITIPQRRGTAVENHPDQPFVVKALAKRGIQGELVSVTNHKPVCGEWHEVYAVELGTYHYDRRTVYALVRFGG